jgi:hypothetical protein
VLAGLGRLWRGDLPLHDAFWTWGLLVALPINLSTSFAFLWLISIDRPLEALVIGNIPSVPYNLVWAVGMWRSAAQLETPWVQSLARAATVVAALVLSVT